MSDKVLVEHIHNHGFDTFTSLQEKTEVIHQIPSKAKSELRLFRRNKNCSDENDKLDHGEKQTFKCDFCQKEFSQLQNLNQHIAIVHTNKKAKIQPSSFKNTETNSRFVKREKSHCKNRKSVVRLSHESILNKNMNRGQEKEKVNNKTHIPKCGANTQAK